MKKFFIKKQLRNLHNTKNFKNKPIFPEYFSIAVKEKGWITISVLETLRRMIKRSIKFRANDIETYIYNYIKPTKPLTAKSKNARMGRGKGMPISKKVFQLQNSTLLFQMPNKFKFNVKYIKFWKKKLPVSSHIIANLKGEYSYLKKLQQI